MRKYNPGAKSGDLPGGWVKKIETSGETLIVDPGIKMTLSKNGAAILNSEGCGFVSGTYTASAPDLIEFDMDTSTITCTEEEPVFELINALDTIKAWHFENGKLFFDLEDGTSLGFEDLGT